MTRAFFWVICAAALTACSQEVPDSGRGVGFGSATDFARQQAEREQALIAAARPVAPVVANVPPPVPVQTQVIPSSELAAAGIGSAALGSLNPIDPAPSPEPPIGAPLSALSPAALPAAPVGPVPTANSPTLSDEQDFSAVASRETIESDAQRRAAQAAAREVIQPTAVPQRPADTGPNIVAYALNAPNRRGQEWWSRSIFATQGRYERNCASYNSPDEAQRAFLSNGGPERDRFGIDPDGDGFACGWDPAPFLQAAGR